MTRPAGLTFWFDDHPAWGTTLGLALQAVALQSAFFIVPVTIAMSITSNASEVARFLALSILAAALWQVVQGLRRGWLGSGYPIPSSFTAATLAAYAIGGSGGAGFGAMGAALMVAGIAAGVLSLLLHRLRAVLPDEVVGVVIMLIGVTLIGVAAHELGLKPGAPLPQAGSVALAIGCILAMAALGFAARRVAIFAVLIGAAGGTAVAFALGLGAPDAAATLAAQPWFAWPRPWSPEFDALPPAALGALLVSLLAIKSTTLGSIVMVQRAADARWTRPDAPPIRRGLLANGLVMAGAGLIGASAPGPSTAAVGLSIATGTLARRIALVGAGLLALLAFCPKLLTLFVLVPQPVKAAMLFYVSGFIVAQGCQVLTARLLDTRRMMVVALGLTAGFAAAAAPQHFLAAMPVLSSPVAFGALVAFCVNLVTLPLVRGASALQLPLDGGAGRAAADWIAGFSGAWGLKPHAGRAAEQAVCEMLDLLAELGVPAVALSARLGEARIEVTLRWSGPPLPSPARRPHVNALMGDDAERHAYAVWLAARQAQGFRQLAVEGGHEARFVFDD